MQIIGKFQALAGRETRPATGSPRSIGPITIGTWFIGEELAAESVQWDGERLITDGGF